VVSDVVQLLEKLANDGRTLICTIHQPSYKLFNTFTRVVFVARGRIVYNGPVKVRAAVSSAPMIRRVLPSTLRSLAYSCTPNALAPHMNTGPCVQWAREGGAFIALCQPGVECVSRGQRIMCMVRRGKGVYT
jgi:energy-coupling factor transporter ATP-binding protein EcfA2